MRPPVAGRRGHLVEHGISFRGGSLGERKVEDWLGGFFDLPWSDFEVVLAMMDSEAVYKC